MLNAAGVPAGRVLDVPSALDLEQIRSRALVEQLEDFEVLGRPLSLVTAGYRLADQTRRIHSAPPRLGEHTDELLGEVGYSSEEIAELRKVSAI
jgi:formyl-CoA transferase